MHTDAETVRGKVQTQRYLHRWDSFPRVLKASVLPMTLPLKTRPQLWTAAPAPPGHSLCLCLAPLGAPAAGFGSRPVSRSGARVPPPGGGGGVAGTAPSSCSPLPGPLCSWSPEHCSSRQGGLPSLFSGDRQGQVQPAPGPVPTPPTTPPSNQGVPSSVPRCASGCATPRLSRLKSEEQTQFFSPESVLPPRPHFHFGLYRWLPDGCPCSVRV